MTRTQSDFDRVTGSNEYERQSWRDNYNGGRAAGDITGNVNRRIDAERAQFGGHTVSGSSAQMSAAEWAASRGDTIEYVGAGGGFNGYAVVTGGAPVPVRTTGVGAATVVAGSTTGPGAAVVGSGVTTGPGAAVVGGGPRRDGTGIQLPVDKPGLLMPVYMAGHRMAMDRGWSNAEDGESRWGENEFLSPSWFHAWGVAGADTWANLNVENDGPIRTRRVQEDLYNAPGVVRDGAIGFAGYLDERRVELTRRAGSHGDHFTGGGF